MFLATKGYPDKIPVSIVLKHSIVAIFVGILFTPLNKKLKCHNLELINN